MKNISRLLVARTDKLGDVLMSLPALKLLREQMPQTQISFLCRQPPIEAIAPLLKKWNVHPFAYADFNPRVPWIYFEAALFLYDDPRAIFGAWSGGTRLRVGNRSKPISQIALQHGLRQHRSESKKSEAEYNLELAEFFLKKIEKPGPYPTPAPDSIPVEPVQENHAIRTLESLGLPDDKSFILLHPGMAGSALNTSAENYVKMIRVVSERRGKPVLLSQGPAGQDIKLVGEIRKAMPEAKVITNLAMGLFREVLRRAHLVVAPSTGPLHLAHWVGTEAVGIFSPVKSHHPVRWAPFGGLGKSRALLPAVECPGTKDCLGKKCKLFPCMETNDWAGLLLNAGND